MQEIQLILTDDMTRHHSGERVGADLTVYLAFGRDPDRLSPQALDLTKEHYDELAELVGPWLGARHRPGAIGSRPGLPPQQAAQAGNDPATRSYNAAMRAFADATPGLEAPAGYRKLEKGGFYYTAALRDAYRVHLISQLVAQG